MAIIKAITILAIALKTELIILSMPPAQVVDRLTSFFKISWASRLLARSFDWIEGNSFDRPAKKFIISLYISGNSFVKTTINLDI